MAQTPALPPVESPTGDDAVITVYRAGERTLPQRGGGGTIDRVSQLAELLRELVKDRSRIDEPAFRKAMAVRAPASVKALATDLDDYAAFCRGGCLPGLPASEVQVVHYIEDCEARGLKPATVARRLASLAAIHSILGCSSPTKRDSVRDALLELRGRSAAQRTADPIRLGNDGLATAPAKGITLNALLEACDLTPPGLRDAALLSLGYDTGLRVSELVAVGFADIELQDDGSAHLPVRCSMTDQAGRGTRAWVSPEAVRRLTDWVEESGIHDGAMFRRVAVRRFKARSGMQARPIRELAWNYRGGDERLSASAGRPARVDYAIGEHALTPAAVRLIIKRAARRAADMGLVPLTGQALDAAIATLSTHSLRVGLTQDLFAAGEDAGSIAQALRWSSPTTAARYGRDLAPASHATARQLCSRRS